MYWNWNPYRKGFNWIDPRHPLPHIGDVPLHYLPKPLPPIGHVPPPVPVPQACKPGYVWREAVPGDFVCVPPQTRDETASENVLGPSRREPGGGDTCKLGFVWRETRPSDHVCVPPNRRERARVDNELAAVRMLYPPDAPSNGIRGWDELVGAPAKFERRIYVSGTFTPNKNVEFYYYSKEFWGAEGLYFFKTVKSNANGNVPLLLETSYCSFYSYPARLPVIVVDVGTGTVSNAGEVANHLCRYSY